MGMEIGSTSGALVVAFLITVLELTEVVAVVYALGAGSRTMTPGTLGAIAGVAVVGGIALGVSVALSAIPPLDTLVVGALLLFGFGAFLFRSTVKTYFREAKKRLGRGDGGPAAHQGEGLAPHALFVGAFSVGAIETVEAAIVLVAISAAGFGWEALTGFILGGVLLVAIGWSLHTRIRQIKVPPLKWVATSLLFTFGVFWTGEALGAVGLFHYPRLGPLPADIWILPIFLVSLGLVGLAVRFAVARRVRSLDAPVHRGTG